eukprot:3025312-Rhodomonas_salina.3
MSGTDIAYGRLDPTLATGQRLAGLVNYVPGPAHILTFKLVYWGRGVIVLGTGTRTEMGVWPKQVERWCMILYQKPEQVLTSWCASPRPGTSISYSPVCDAPEQY